MLAPALIAIRDYFEAHYSGLPHRWPNEEWPDTNPETARLPFLEIEIIGGQNAIRSFSAPGSRLFIHPGLIRFYIFAPNGTGTTDAQATADQIGAFMERAEFGQATGQTVRTLDFSTYSGVASVENGNFQVLLASVPFDFYYIA